MINTVTTFLLYFQTFCSITIFINIHKLLKAELHKVWLEKLKYSEEYSRLCNRWKPVVEGDAAPCSVCQLVGVTVGLYASYKCRSHSSSGRGRGAQTPLAASAESKPHQNKSSPRHNKERRQAQQMASKGKLGLGVASVQWVIFWDVLELMH